MASTVHIGARGSPLSLVQTGLVRDALAAANPGRTFEITPIVTTGDRIQDRALTEAGGKGLFTKELDEAMLAGRIALAVHSMKDLPTQLPDGIVLAATPRREDPRDALICLGEAGSLAALPDGAHIGTASLRRQAQLLSRRPGFRISMLRGNVETRLRKVADGVFDATLLAYAGLRRLGLERHARCLIDPWETPSACGQGALAITARADDALALVLVAPIEDLPTRLEVTAERAFLSALDGSCRTPIGALGRWSDGAMRFVGEALTPDGAQVWRREGEAACASQEAAAALGMALGRHVRREAGDALYGS
ncbi:hydroxymethylbilane synthase [Caulobacter sp. S45]|uniref:hydroxymethylbilane synthase n=1 Tax=Caulobacter sp. S45 TaxID=1641861 RepID=UPI001576C153|nr:hydroxymethylbilane synthase [Caulobacter sp. S45]